MYLNKHQIRALELALEAMENFTNRSDEEDDAINTIVKMLSSARDGRLKKKSVQWLYK